MIAHSSETNEHYTPALIVDRARATLGEIDLDPASCAAGQAVVRAEEYWTSDGLGQAWHGRVFLNPPGGKLDRVTLQPIKAGPGLSSAAVWWAKLWSEWNVGNVEAAIFVCFSLAIFRTAQEFAPEVPAPFDFPFCVSRDRINYDRLDPTIGVRIPTKGAPADSAIVLIPPKSERPAHPAVAWGGPMIDRFRDQFSPLGVVRI